jgi:hypothetical protein
MEMMGWVLEEAHLGTFKLLYLNIHGMGSLMRQEVFCGTV